MQLYIDIETLPPLEWDEARRLDYVQSKVPGNYKKPESIAQWVAENFEETWARAALDWRISRIACIGVAIDDGSTVHGSTFVGGTDDADERRMFTELEWWLREHYAWTAHVVGHNVIGFDIPRLHLVASRLHHSLAAWLHDISEDHRKRVTDTMHMAFPTRERVSLADLASALGLEGKTGKGSDVLPMWIAGDLDGITSYCMNDVLLTRRIHHTLSGAFDAHS